MSTFNHRRVLRARALSVMPPDQHSEVITKAPAVWAVGLLGVSLLMLWFAIDGTTLRPVRAWIGCIGALALFPPVALMRTRLSTSEVETYFQIGFGQRGWRLRTKRLAWSQVSTLEVERRDIDRVVSSGATLTIRGDRNGKRLKVRLSSGDDNFGRAVGFVTRHAPERAVTQKIEQLRQDYEPVPVAA